MEVVKISKEDSAAEMITIQAMETGANVTDLYPLLCELTTN